MEPFRAMIGLKFDKADYEEKLNEYYENYSLIISRLVFNNTIVDTLQGKKQKAN